MARKPLFRELFSSYFFNHWSRPYQLHNMYPQYSIHYTNNAAFYHNKLFIQLIQLVGDKCLVDKVIFAGKVAQKAQLQFHIQTLHAPKPALCFSVTHECTLLW